MSWDGPAPAADPAAPYVRLAVAALICRPGAGSVEASWLLLRRAGALECWDPPGGRLERFEDLADGVRREVREETGLSVLVEGPCYAYLAYHKGERLVAVSMSCRIDPEGRDADGVRLEPGVVGWAWKTAEEWADLARRGLSTWSVADVRRVTHLAEEIWEGDGL